MKNSIGKITLVVASIASIIYAGSLLKNINNSVFQYENIAKDYEKMYLQAKASNSGPHGNINVDIFEMSNLILLKKTALNRNDIALLSFGVFVFGSFLPIMILGIWCKFK